MTQGIKGLANSQATSSSLYKNSLFDRFLFLPAARLTYINDLKGRMSYPNADDPEIMLDFGTSGTAHETNFTSQKRQVCT
jgi:hypothetical protein